MRDGADGQAATVPGRKTPTRQSRPTAGGRATWIAASVPEAALAWVRTTPPRASFAISDADRPAMQAYRFAPVAQSRGTSCGYDQMLSQRS